MAEKHAAAPKPHRFAGLFPLAPDDDLAALAETASARTSLRNGPAMRQRRRANSRRKNEASSSISGIAVIDSHSVTRSNLYVPRFEN